MIALSVSMRFAPEVFDDMQQFVRRLAELSRQDHGCVEYWWAVSMEEPHTLRLFEAWDTNENLQAHLSLPHEKEFMAECLPKVISSEVFTYDPTTRAKMGG